MFPVKDNTKFLLRFAAVSNAASLLHVGVGVRRHL